MRTAVCALVTLAIGAWTFPASAAWLQKRTDSHDGRPAATVDVVYPAGMKRSVRIRSDSHGWIGVNGRRRESIHQGIDIAGRAGQTVIATADGRVVETHIEPCWGPTIVIEHGPDRDARPLFALYGHVGEILLREGQPVSRGTPSPAWETTTGNSSAWSAFVTFTCRSAGSGGLPRGRTGGMHTSCATRSTRSILTCCGRAGSTG